ncbi:oxidoreductase [Nocardia cyriacigeorgica]|jgi:NAD(P)-dependent dehydrogenase (short-subunit alcohol dehydrogenase family)|uniref:oxidoreductase n=1 Tax=Nocardia cyriacigeorgica TaxID=135487 RepID=UPI001896291C|nr:oxidoreductase [Nocardia cyriacigeorgica]MBF6456335.1 SDR family NAD(P)-dependent oxidoreductase [Nocardia cyriacigeorgica]MBF6477544.1 SDR family NAD(P)-dependent oxidoreductase [Nocardia cyriacigeorgica]MBF6551141.1 SDR family NAD(P)-dependent oxidoreductase [Nocardia cyriacigeorgica]
MTGWSVSDIPDQQGRTVIVTGANSGLGAVAARALAGAGARVVLACRNVDKGRVVAEEIGPLAEVRRLDLADLSSVREFAASVDRVDVLINNAGVMAVPYARTADGFEMQIGTNHLGHFALTGLLLGRISDRVVTVSSDMHRLGVIDLDDLNWQRRKYRRWPAYGQAKLANLLFAYELQRRLTAAGWSKRSVAAHPGYAATELQSHTESIQDLVMSLGNRLFAQSAEMGALPELYAATADVEPGGYYGPTGFRGMRGHPGRAGSNARSRDQETARGLWKLSEELTGVSYDFSV